MLSLILDTSSRTSIIALGEDEKILIAEILPHDNKLTQKLIPSIHSLLVSQGLKAKDLHYIGTGIGPGSFTGTRVGVTNAKTLAFALQIPVIGFCSLAAFLPFESGSFLAIYHTTTGECFALKGEKRENKILYLSKGVQIPFEEISYHGAHVDFIIAMPEAYCIKEIFPSTKRVLKGKPNVDPLASLCYQKFAQREKEGEKLPELIYLQPSRGSDSLKT